MRIKKTTIRCSGEECRNTLERPVRKGTTPLLAILKQARWIYRGDVHGRIYYCHVCAAAVEKETAAVAAGRHYTLDTLKAWATGSETVRACCIPLIKGDSMQRADSDKGLIRGPCTVVTRFWADGGIDQKVSGAS